MAPSCSPPDLTPPGQAGRTAVSSRAAWQRAGEEKVNGEGQARMNDHGCNYHTTTRKLRRIIHMPPTTALVTTPRSETFSFRNQICSTFRPAIATRRDILLSIKRAAIVTQPGLRDPKNCSEISQLRTDCYNRTEASVAGSGFQGRAILLRERSGRSSYLRTSVRRSVPE